VIYGIAKNGQRILILEPGNIARIKSGQPLKSPDEQIMIAYCPDIEWLKQTIAPMVALGELDVAVLDATLKEGLKRLPVMR